MRTRTLLAAFMTLTLVACGSKDSPSPNPSAATGAASGAPTQAPTSPAPPAPTTTDTSTVKITSPVQGGTVQQCHIVTGTAVLSPGKTLVTAMQNTSNGDPNMYFEPVSNWQVPDQLASWTAKQYFGSGDDSKGQGYAITVFSGDRAIIEQGFKSSKPTWTAKEMPPGLKAVARVEVKRVAGKGPTECQ
jgi:hypothetical protein